MGGYCEILEAEKACRWVITADLADLRKSSLKSVIV